MEGPPSELIRLHLELECIGTGGRDIWRIPCADADEMPLVYVARHAEGYSVYLNRDLSRDVRDALEALPPEDVYSDRQTVLSILSRQGNNQELWRGLSYLCAREISSSEHPDVTLLNQRHSEMLANSGLDLVGKFDIFGVLLDGRVVCTCESTRENDKSGEAWVQTHPAYRGRGYARQATVAWAHALQAKGKIPFYSHRAENLASRALAQSLGLHLYIADVGYG